MGTDITLYAEIFKHGKWEPVPETIITEWSEGEIVATEPIEFGRPYELFMALAGVGTANKRRTMHAQMKPIAEPRGLPEDINEFYKQTVLNNAYDLCFGHSWLMVQEVIDYDWDNQFVTKKAYVKNKYSVYQASEVYPTRAVAHPHATCYKSGNLPNAVAPLARGGLGRGNFVSHQSEKGYMDIY